MIPQYPKMAPIDISMNMQVQEHLKHTRDSISEFTFAGLYLFRKTYHYQLCLLPDNTLLISGHKDNLRFCMFPQTFPCNMKILTRILDEYDYIKALGNSQLSTASPIFQALDIPIVEDRNNFDYVYLSKDMAHLHGKQYHKKRNHINAFVNTYTHTRAPITPENTQDALSVLTRWHMTQNADSDYTAAKDALLHFQLLNLEGYLWYVENKPAAYSIGEPAPQKNCFIIHFEKANTEYKGIYQYINKAFAVQLAEKYTYINREQDLGNIGMRQAKLTYRPYKFIKKYCVGKNIPTHLHHDITQSNQVIA